MRSNMAGDNHLPGSNQKSAERASESLTIMPDETESRLVAIWQELLSMDSVGIDQNFFDLGGDSSLAVRMFAEIEKIFKVKLPLATLYETPTIETLAPLVRGEATIASWSPLVAIQPSGSRPPFFCIHGAGGNVLIYRDLSKHLGPDQPFYGLQAQGLDGSLPPLTKVEDMAALYLKEITRVQAHGPYFLGGYCGGGTIAYEVAQQLQARGENVALLAMFDTMNWSKIPITLWSKSSYAVQKLVFHAGSLLSLDLPGVSRYLEEKTEILRSRIPVWRGVLMSKFGKAPDGTQSMAFVLGRIWQTNDMACWQYVPKPYRGMVTDFRPSKQYRIFSKPDLKWDQLALGGQDVIVLPVFPASMLLEPFVKHLADSLTKSMDHAIESGR